MDMDAYMFPRRREEALIGKLRKAKEMLVEENSRLKEENARLRLRTGALEENLATLETKLRIQRHAWEELANKEKLFAKPYSQPGRGVSKILKDVETPIRDHTKPPVASLNLDAIKDHPPAGHRPASSRPMSMRPMSARPVSARPVSARPPSGRPDARMRPFSARYGIRACTRLPSAQNDVADV
jgi:hypothetical protein